MQRQKQPPTELDLNWCPNSITKETQLSELIGRSPLSTAYVGVDRIWEVAFLQLDEVRRDLIDATR